MKPLLSVLFSLLIFGKLCAQLPQPILSSLNTAPPATGFLKNVGQVTDIKNNPVDFVYYQANFGGQQVFITKYGLSILLAREKKITRVAGRIANDHQLKHTPAPADSSLIVNYEMERIDIVLKNASIQTANIVTVANELSPQFNFYINDPYAKVQQLLNEILIKNVYPGIDWKVYIRKEKGQPASLKYDFIVHPGADPSLIQLRYSDNAKLELDGNKIKAKTKMGIVKEEQPYSYLQEDQSAVPVAYLLKNNTIHFTTGSYSKTSTLVIDPSIFWMTYLTSTVQALAYRAIVGNDVETDAAGNIFVQLSGEANCPFPVKNPGGGAYYQDITASPNGGMIMLKFAAGGQLLWSTYFGNGVAGRCMTIDKTGNITAVGILLQPTSTVLDQHSSIPLLNSGGYYDGKIKNYFIAKFSNAGVLLWSSYYLNFSSYPTDMSYDINGNIYVVGWSEVYDFPVVDPGGGAYIVNNAQFGYAQVLFISQFNAGNQLTWSTRIEGNNYDPQARVCTDKAGNIYLGGQVRSGNYPLVDAGGYFSATDWGAVITRFNPARKMTWSTYYPSPFSLEDLTCDDSCNLYVVADRRIVKFDSSTNLVFEKSVATTQMYFLNKINYDHIHDQLQVLGVMNDDYTGFPTINTACNGSFFHDGTYPRRYNNGTGPIFATMTTGGVFSYLSLTDWVYEYYDRNEMAIDSKGDPVYLFCYQQDGYTDPNPQLTNPGNGAYFDPSCCYLANSNSSALILKLRSSDLSLVTQVVSPAGCQCTGVATVTAQCGQAPFSYLWSTGDTTSTASALCPGNYSVKVTDANNLSQTVNITITKPPGGITAASATMVPENCSRKNGQINIQSVQGGTAPYTYAIDGTSYNPAPQFTGIQSGTHILSVKDANGCIYQDSLAVSKIAGPSVVTNTVQPSSCIAGDGQIIITSVTGGIAPYQYTLTGVGTNTTGLFKGLDSATYQLTVADTAGCSFTKMIVVQKAMPATDVALTTSNDHCNQGIGKIAVGNVTGGLSPYAFSLDSISFVTGAINNLHKGSYNFYLRDANGCVLKKSPVTVANEAGPVTTNFITTNAYCGKSTGNIVIQSVNGGSAPYQYSLDSVSYNSMLNFANIKPGSHTLFVKDAFGCIIKQPVNIQYKYAARFNLSPADTTVCYNETVQVTLQGDVNLLKGTTWNVPAQGSAALIKATDEKHVLVTITDSNDCVTTASGIIRVKACNTPANCMAIPAAFTPNLDGKNDKLIPLANGCSIESINFRIYDRYGKLVFYTTKQGEGWNGIYKGEAQPGGAYIYTCDYISNGITIQKKGTTMLVR